MQYQTLESYWETMLHVCIDVNFLEKIYELIRHTIILFPGDLRIDRLVWARLAPLQVNLAVIGQLDTH